MITLVWLLVLVVAFFLLAKSADLIVVHIRHIGERLGINTIFLGLLLGLFTTMPEFGLALSAFANGVEDLSFGNLIGGIAVELGLILGIGALLNRNIKTKEMNGSTPFTLSLLFLPLLLGVDGRLGMIDGVVLVLFYLCVGYSLFSWHRRRFGRRITFFPHRSVATDFFLVILGSIFVLVLSNVIVRVTLELLTAFQVSAFLVGLVVFAIGTNLPELSVMIRAWQRGASDLSVSHLIGSAMANILLLGFLAFIYTIPVQVDRAYMGLMVAMALLLAGLYVFLRSGNVLSRREGVVLLVGYLLVLFSQALVLF